MILKILMVAALLAPASASANGKCSADNYKDCGEKPPKSDRYEKSEKKEEKKK